jgi:hypothetical protein
MVEVQSKKYSPISKISKILLKGKSVYLEMNAAGAVVAVGWKYALAITCELIWWTVYHLPGEQTRAIIAFMYMHKSQTQL